MNPNAIKSALIGTVGRAKRAMTLPTITPKSGGWII
jgi:hypothetical protein